MVLSPPDRGKQECNSVGSAKSKIERVKQYWKNTIKPNFKPKIDYNKKLEIDLRLSELDKKIEKSRKKFRFMNIAV